MAEPGKIEPARRAVRRLRWGIAGIVLVAGLTATIVVRPRPYLVWNVSASAPVGLYSLSADGYPEKGDMVVARVPARWRELAARRRYIPANVPLVKRVVAEPGDTVCALGEDILINARRVAERRHRDAMGRALPWWSGCIVLRKGALFLLTANPSSFDGRYFGPTQRGDVIGRARLLWRR